jgi:hypothetical protein
MLTKPEHLPQPANGPPAVKAADHSIGDLRFRALLSEEDWRRLPICTPRRFSERLARGLTTVYVGTMVKAWFSRVGFILVGACRAAHRRAVAGQS